MRILTLTNWYPPHHRGGYEINCQDVMIRMSRRGHDVIVVCGDEILPGIAPGEEDSCVHRVLRLYWRDEAPWVPSAPVQTRIEAHNQTAVKRYLETFEPDLVSVWHMAAISVNLLSVIAEADLPLVYAICDSWPSYTVLLDPWSKTFNSSDRRRRVGRVIERLFGLHAVLPDVGNLGRACFVSQFTRDDVRANSRWTFPNSTVIASGVDRPSLGGMGESRRPWSGKLAYFGRFDPRKGTDTLLRALPLLPSVQLSMYGRAGVAERERLADLAEGLGVADRVSFATLERHELGTAYRNADCVVFPSEWPEPFGLVPLEAMECGTPVIATGVGGSADFLFDKHNCLLFEAGSPEALAHAIQKLAGDSGLRGRLREAGRETARQYDVDRMADLYEREFQTAADRR